MIVAHRAYAWTFLSNLLDLVVSNLRFGELFEQLESEVFLDKKLNASSGPLCEGPIRELGHYVER